MRTNALWLSGLLLVLAAGCGPSTPSGASARLGTGGPCLSLSEPDGTGPSTSPPSRVSWSFRVDTCGGEPVASLSATQFEIFEDGKKVSAFESQQRIAAKGERFRLYSVVLLDLSGSMLRSGDFSQLQSAAGAYLATALAGGADAHRVQLMTFDGRASPQVLVPFTADLATLKAGLASLSVAECTGPADCARYPDRRTCAGWRCVDDSTNLNGAVVQALQALDVARATSEVPWRDGALVVFTDGTDQAGRVSTADVLAAVRATNERLFAIGLGGEVDVPVLRELGRDGFWPVAKAELLQGTFEELARRMAALANRFYVLEYCSPRRGGVHALEVRASARGADGGALSGTLSGMFDARGFESGCEL